MVFVLIGLCAVIFVTVFWRRGKKSVQATEARCTAVIQNQECLNMTLQVSRRTGEPFCWGCKLLANDSLLHSGASSLGGWH